MRLYIAVLGGALSALAGCAGVSEVRNDLDKLKERVHAIDVRLEALAGQVKRVQKTYASRQELASLKRQELEGIKATCSRLAEEVRNIRQDFTYSLDEAVSAVKGDVRQAKKTAEATSSAQASLKKELEGKLASSTSAMKKLEGELKDLRASSERAASERAEEKKARSELSRRVAEADRAVAALRSQLGEVQKTVADLKKELSQLAEKVAERKAPPPSQKKGAAKKP